MVNTCTNSMLIVFVVVFQLVASISAQSVGGPQQDKVNKTTQMETQETSTLPMETQSAQCLITAGDVQASAEASISRKLEGVCTPNHVTRAFSNLEIRMLNEINQLKAMLNVLLPPIYQNNFFAHPQPYLYEAITEPTLPIAATTQRTVSQQTASSTQPNVEQTTPASAVERMQNESPLAVLNNETNAFKYANESSADLNVTTPSFEWDTKPFDTDSSTERVLEFRPVEKKIANRSKFIYPRKKTGPREFEIHKFNNTILSGADLRIFTYYWKIEHFSQKLKANISRINSPVFSISGLHLRLKAILHHLNRDYLYLQLESLASEVANENSNIILEAGNAFKDIQTQELFKHKIAILDQVTPTSDLISHEFVNTKSGFSVPNNALLRGPYAKDDNILIKIVIYL